jgi:hypothetical protein
MQSAINHQFFTALGSASKSKLFIRNIPILNQVKGVQSVALCDLYILTQF